MSREGFVHNQYVSSLENNGLEYGYDVLREFEARGLGWIDLFMLQNGHRIAIEIEMRARRNRLAMNIAKAKVVGATELLVIACHRDVIHSFQRTMRTLENETNGMPIYLLLKHEAAKRLRDLSTAP